MTVSPTANPTAGSLGAVRGPERRESAGLLLWQVERLSPERAQALQAHPEWLSTLLL